MYQNMKFPLMDADIISLVFENAKIRIFHFHCSVDDDDKIFVFGSGTNAQSACSALQEKYQNRHRHQHIAIASHIACGAWQGVQRENGELWKKSKQQLWSSTV